MKRGVVDRTNWRTYVRDAGEPTRVHEVLKGWEYFVHRYMRDVTSDGNVKLGDGQIAIKIEGDGPVNALSMLKHGVNLSEKLAETGIISREAADRFMNETWNFATPEDGGYLPKGRYVVGEASTYKGYLQNMAAHAKIGQGSILRTGSQTWRNLTTNTLMRSLVNNAGSIMMTMLDRPDVISAMHAAHGEWRSLVHDNLTEIVDAGIAGSHTKNLEAGKYFGKLPGKIGDTAAVWSPARYNNAIRFGNRSLENWSRETQAIANLKAAARGSLRDQYGVLEGTRKALHQDILRARSRELLKDPVFRDQLIQRIEDFNGAMSRVTRADDALYAVGTFWKWYEHVAKLTLYTLPFKYPGRALLLNQMGQLGQDYAKRNGIWPSWLTGVILLGQLDQQAGSQRAFSTQGWWPFATVSQSVLPTNLSGTSYAAPKLLGMVNPVISSIPNVLTGKDWSQEDPAVTSLVQANQPSFGVADVLKGLSPLGGLWNKLHPAPPPKNPNTIRSVPADDGLGGFIQWFTGINVRGFRNSGPVYDRQFHQQLSYAKKDWMTMTKDDRRAMIQAWANGAPSPAGNSLNQPLPTGGLQPVGGGLQPVGGGLQPVGGGLKPVGPLKKVG
jgi:hypothetical protein